MFDIRHPKLDATPIEVWIQWGQSNSWGQEAAGSEWVNDGTEGEILHCWSSATPPDLGQSEWGPLAPISSGSYGWTPSLLPIRTINANVSQKLALMNVSLGSTSLGPARAAPNNWQFDGQLYQLRILEFLRNRMAELYRMGYAPRLSTLVTFQGESDWQDTELYASRLVKFCDALKREFGAPSMAVIETKVWHLSNDHTAIRAAQDEFASIYPNTLTVDSKDLDRADDVHLSATGMQQLSPLIVSAYESLF